MNKGDVILVVILTATVAMFGADMWLVVNGFEQFSPGAWTCFAAVFAGELLAFALYKIGKGRGGYRPLSGKHSAVDMLENDQKEK